MLPSNRSNLLDIFKTPQAAMYLALSKPTLERFRISGGGPRYCKLGGAVRYRRCDLDDWLESRLIRSTSEES
jgi:excisionase family DNA binding protein